MIRKKKLNFKKNIRECYNIPNYIAMTTTSDNDLEKNLTFRILENVTIPSAIVTFIKIYNISI